MGDEKSIHACAAWKQRANITNLLVNAIQPLQAALPVTELGISLSYLKRFSESLGDWMKGGDTTAVVKAIVVTLTAKAPWSKKGRCAGCIAGWTSVAGQKHRCRDCLDTALSALQSIQDEHGRSYTPVRAWGHACSVIQSNLSAHFSGTLGYQARACAMQAEPAQSFT